MMHFKTIVNQIKINSLIWNQTITEVFLSGLLPLLWIMVGKFWTNLVHRETSLTFATNKPKLKIILLILKIFQNSFSRILYKIFSLTVTSIFIEEVLLCDSRLRATGLFWVVFRSPQCWRRDSWVPLETL